MDLLQRSLLNPEIFSQKILSKKYTTTEHILYFHVLCGVFILAYVLYARFTWKQSVSDILRVKIYGNLRCFRCLLCIIAPCQTLSIKQCKNPATAKSIVNLNTLFFLSFIFIRNTKFSKRNLFGIVLTLVGIYFVI
jgi:hypothetical protein